MNGAASPARPTGYRGTDRESIRDGLDRIQRCGIARTSCRKREPRH
jgi:hypothetical protein